MDGPARHRTDYADIGQEHRTEHHPDGLPCPRCGRVIPSVAEVFAAHFRGMAIQCPLCSAAFDWWAAAVDQVTSWPSELMAFCLVGSTTAYREVELPPDRGIQLNVDEQLGVPPDAEILRVSYAPMVPGEQNGPLPMEMTQWEAGIRTIPHVLQLYGATYGKPTPQSSWMAVSVTFVAHEEDEASARNLATAASQFASGRYHAVLVPANVAVEAALHQTVELALSCFVGSSKLKRFLEDAATYFHQLHVLVPLLVHMTGAPPLPDRLRDQLTRLLTLRNQMGHRGRTRGTVSKTDAAELLVAAVFGYHYARLLRDEIAKAQTEGRLPTAPADLSK
jgi:hypothetical protein